MGKFRDGMPVTAEAVTLILSTIDRIKSILDAIEKSEQEPEGGDGDLIDPLGRMARREAAAPPQVAPPPPAPAPVELKKPDKPEPTEKADKQDKPAAARRRPRRPARQPFDPRQCRHARSSDDHRLGAGADPQPAARDRPPPRGFRFQGAAAAALQRHRRAAGRRDEDAHAADRQCVAETAARGARPVRRARQGHRA